MLSIARYASVADKERKSCIDLYAIPTDSGWSSEKQDLHASSASQFWRYGCMLSGFLSRFWRYRSTSTMPSFQS